MNPNTSSLHDTKSLVNSFKSVSSFKKDLTQMSVGGITDFISDYSKIMVSLSKNYASNQSSNSEVDSISSYIDTVQDVLDIISNCMTALQSYTNDKYSSVIENMISVTALTTNTTDPHVLKNEAFEVVILPDLTNQTSNQPLALNGSITIATPDSLISKTAQSGKKLSLGSVKYLYSSKIVPSQTVQFEFNSTTTTIIADTSQDLLNTIQSLSNNFTSNSTLSTNNSSSSTPFVRVSISPIISVEYLQNGLITALTNLSKPIRMNFPAVNTSMISQIEQFTKPFNLKYNFIFFTSNAYKLLIRPTINGSNYHFIHLYHLHCSNLCRIAYHVKYQIFTKQPIKSRWIFPYLSLIALFIENAFSNIVSDSITLSINNGTSNISYDSVNIIRDVSAMVVVTLVSLAIWNFVLNHLRYILFRYMYEIMFNERQVSLQQVSPFLKLISRKRFMMLSNCAMSVCVIAYFVIFISLTRTSVIISTTYSWIMSLSFFVFVMIMTICLIGIYLFDIYMEFKYKQISSEMQNVGKDVLSNATSQTSKLENFVQGITKSFPKTGVKGVQVNLNFYSTSSFLRRLQHFFSTNDRLFFRLEAVIFFTSIVFYIVAYALGFSVLSNSSTSSITSTYSQITTSDDMNTILQLAFNLVFQTLFEAGFIISFGGLVFIGAFIKNSKNVSTRDASSSTTMNMDQNEQDDVSKLLKNPSAKKYLNNFVN
ncbi:hypothetical protein FDP41_010182 [Naegleria fowleri]|uniref:Uncharacterized protein n=1 Tax=Naegleria fowleri TaxID=5763 RepID=A0A6A5B9S5_NAEFO|nr:uncharacterized protein FDP41_010182 [Naegleria fowleri]KAF0971576.1 hypothetical protein FDP41_010182 [Naegleria fowleri]